MNAHPFEPASGSGTVLLRVGRTHHSHTSTQYDDQVIGRLSLGNTLLSKAPGQQPAGSRDTHPNWLLLCGTPSCLHKV